MTPFQQKPSSPTDLLPPARLFKCGAAIEVARHRRVRTFSAKAELIANAMDCNALLRDMTAFDRTTGEAFPKNDDWPIAGHWSRGGGGACRQAASRRRGINDDEPWRTNASAPNGGH